ncbi:MAG TPA: PEGA domain-containing protein [Candidatus Eisenbacteria bacterium]|nr:PEGA domain-containing protein [Candidatus Eisenbacteria bacterium]
MRLDTVHLVHSGLPEAWSLEEAEALLFESSQLIVATPEGAMHPQTSLPEELESWIEVVRYAHRELWEGTAGVGTTVVLTTPEALWVYTRGGQRVSMTAADRAAEAREVARPEGRGKLWKLDPYARWTVEARIEGVDEPIWTARWRPALTLVPPRVEAVASAPVAETVVESFPVSDEVPVAPARRAWYVRPLALVRRRWRRDAWLRRGVLTLCAVLLGAFALSRVPRAPMQRAGLWIGDVVWGRYRVWVTSVPPGTKVLVDGRDTGKRTPAWIVLASGEHRVETSLGEYGTTSFSVKGGRGGRDTKSVALLGRLALGCADSTITLSARMDGRAIGQLPATLDSVPAGRRQVSFQGRDVTPWVEEVSVIAGQTTSFLARPERVPDNGVVIARAYRVGPEGLKDLPGAVLFLDGKKACVTPGKLVVSRGLHTARLTSGNESSPVQLLRVEGGGELYATAEFGRSPEPGVSDQLVGLASLAKPPLVRATLQSQLPVQVGEMKISVRRWGREFSRVSMNLHDGAGGPVGEAVLPLAGMPPGSTLDYFVTIKSVDGEEFVSEMRTVKIVP